MSLRFVAAVALALLAPALARAELPVKPPIMPGAAPLDEPGRYRVARTFDETIDYYERLFRGEGGTRWHNIINQPGIKAKHVASLRKVTEWEGINVYEHRGEVRIYVISRPKKAAPAKARGK